MYLDEIDEEAIDTYRNQRQRQPITTHKRPIKGTKVSYATVNRELAILRRLLRLAKRHKKIKGVPEFELKSEKPLARNRVLSAVEYQALLESSPRYAQRVFIGLNETAMRVNELLKLTWDRVNEAEGFIRLRAEDVKEKRARVIPISAEVRSVLAELKAEQRSAKVKDFGGRVFTRNGAAIKNIRKPFEAARNASGLNDIHLHDFCHTCITAWEMNGLPQGVIMAASGHHSREMHNRYVNPTEQHIKEAFKNCERIVNKESGVDDAAVVTA